MQKLRSKLGLVVVLSCLTLAVGLMASTGSASANGGRHPHVSRISPRISMKVLSGHFKFHGHYVQRVVLSGVGFDTCDSCGNAAAYNGCDGSCNSGCDACSASCPYYSYATNACGNNCQSCDAPSGNSCANYNACGTDGSNGSASCPSNCGSTTGNIGIVGSISGNGSPSCSSNCDGTTGNVGVGGTSGAPCASYNACGSASSCDCANVQSNLPIYGQDANLSQVPLNAFGEFRVTVLIVVPAHSSRAHYRMWAIDRYNNDCSNILNGSQSW